MNLKRFYADLTNYVTNEDIFRAIDQSSKSFLLQSIFLMIQKKKYLKLSPDPKHQTVIIQEMR